MWFFIHTYAPADLVACNFPVHLRDYFQYTGTLNLGCLTRYFVFCRVDESALTGESEDVVKTAGKAPFLRSGSKVLEGQGRLLVTAVGTNSQQGQIFGALNAPSDGMRSQFACNPQVHQMTIIVRRGSCDPKCLAKSSMLNQPCRQTS